MVTRTKKIFVGGLSASTTLDDVKAYFSQFGKVGYSTGCIHSSIHPPVSELSPPWMHTRIQWHPTLPHRWRHDATLATATKRDVLPMFYYHAQFIWSHAGVYVWISVFQKKKKDNVVCITTEVMPLGAPGEQVHGICFTNYHGVRYMLKCDGGICWTLDKTWTVM